MGHSLRGTIHQQFHTRLLYLDTSTLDPATRSAVEFIAKSEGSDGTRIHGFRNLFTTVSPDRTSITEYRGVGSCEYMEDDAGNEVSPDELARILSGSPHARAIPHGAKQHDIEFMFSAPEPMPIESASLSESDHRLFGYFARDLRELTGSVFMTQKSTATLSMTDTPNCVPKLQTSTTDDEIRSFVTVFRRLYMTNEEACFANIVPAFVAAVGNVPHGRWVQGCLTEYQRELDSPVDCIPLIRKQRVLGFKVKRLIDAYIYTQYAHQPREDRERHFADCLAEVDGKRDLLTWLFLTELRMCSGRIAVAGKIIVGWFERYCAHHRVAPSILDSLRSSHEGIGKGEKEQDRRARLMNEQVVKLSHELWELAGRPSGGPLLFEEDARKQLVAALSTQK